MTHGLGPGKPAPRAAKPITPPYVENNYRIEVKITFMLIAYLVLLCEFFWEFSIFHFCRPLVDIYWHLLFKKTQKVERNTLIRLMFTPTILSCSSHFLCALQQKRAQSRLLYLLIVYYLTSPYVMLLPGGIFEWKSFAGTLEPLAYIPHLSSVKFHYPILD